MDVRGLLLRAGYRPIAFNPFFAKITDSVATGVFLSQALYWQEKVGVDGWFYKSSNQWKEETCLTRREQEVSRKTLQRLLILKEKLTGTPATLHFQIDLTALADALSQFVISDKLVCSKVTNKFATSVQTSLLESDKLYKEAETTTETTQRVNPPPPSSEGFSATESKPKTKPNSDPRFKEFIEALKVGYSNRKWAFVWGAPDGKQLKNLLSVDREMNVNKFRICLANYFKSEGTIPGAMPYTYLARLPNYWAGPLNQYGKLLDAAPAEIQI